MMNEISMAICLSEINYDEGIFVFSERCMSSEDSLPCPEEALRQRRRSPSSGRMPGRGRGVTRGSSDGVRGSKAGEQGQVGSRGKGRKRLKEVLIGKGLNKNVHVP